MASDSVRIGVGYGAVWGRVASQIDRVHTFPGGLPSVALPTPLRGAGTLGYSAQTWFGRSIFMPRSR
jgi:hypothetical protein